MSLDCFGLGYVKIEPTIEDSTKTLVLFISHVSHNISLLIIDDKYNTIRTYTREEFISYEYYNYTGLEKNIQYGESVALENGNFMNRTRGKKRWIITRLYRESWTSEKRCFKVVQRISDWKTAFTACAEAMDLRDRMYLSFRVIYR